MKTTKRFLITLFLIITGAFMNMNAFAEVVTYAGVPTEKWDFANGEFTESLNGVSSAEGRGYSSKYFSVKADKIYYFDFDKVTANRTSGTITVTAKNKNTGTTFKDMNYDDMVYSFSFNGTGEDSLGAALEFRTDADIYFEITTASPQSATLFGTYTVKEADLTHFNDISGHWAESTINKWASKGIISGYPDGTFKPDIPVTRGELSKILAISLGLSDKSDVIYEDVSLDKWYYPYLELSGKYIPNYPLPVGYDNNIPYQTINEKGLNYFLPDTPAMRMHIAEALVEIKKAKENLNPSVPDISEVQKILENTFKDDDYENLYTMHGTVPKNVRRMFEYTYLAKELNIMHGDTNGYFMPYANVTRAELITAIDRILPAN